MDPYVFGHALTVESNHKPLEQIKLKNLADTPLNVIVIKYSPGKKMLVADALCHHELPDAPEMPLDITIIQVQITSQETEVKAAIYYDPLLCSITDKILTRWLEDINDVPCPLHPYHAHSDILAVKDGPILYGEVLIIPSSEREKVLQEINEDHLGITKCQYHTQQCVYWSEINSDISA